MVTVCLCCWKLYVALKLTGLSINIIFFKQHNKRLRKEYYSNVHFTSVPLEIQYLLP